VIVAFWKENKEEDAFVCFR
jgi:hypothetical protein